MKLLQVAPLAHGSFAQQFSATLVNAACMVVIGEVVVNLGSTVQLSPEKPLRQMQLHLSNTSVFMHNPPFWHGLGAQQGAS
jgi:hypothetical protein